MARGNLAVTLDCYLACACDADNVKWQILFDKLLYDVDRAIDAYSLGSTDFGEAEARASANSCSPGLWPITMTAPTLSSSWLRRRSRATRPTR